MDDHGISIHSADIMFTDIFLSVGEGEMTYVTFRNKAKNNLLYPMYFDLKILGEIHMQLTFRAMLLVWAPGLTFYHDSHCKYQVRQYPTNARRLWKCLEESFISTWLNPEHSREMGLCDTHDKKSKSRA